jgi:hypothetical protein
MNSTMIEYHLTYEDAATRVVEVIGSIISSQEWTEHSHELSRLTFSEAREPFRRFFDAYEGGDGIEWLGIMENGVIEEMLLRGVAFTADPVTIEAVVARMERHPNVRLER